MKKSNILIDIITTGSKKSSKRSVSIIGAVLLVAVTIANICGCNVQPDLIWALVCITLGSAGLTKIPTRGVDNTAN